MYLLCPACHNPMELTERTLPEAVLCPACGSSIPVPGGPSTVREALAGPARLGRFEVLGQVGSGAFGTVYRARDPELDRTVAIKVPRAVLLAGTGDAERFLREARSGGRLRH